MNDVPHALGQVSQQAVLALGEMQRHLPRKADRCTKLIMDWAGSARVRST